MDCNKFAGQEVSNIIFISAFRFGVIALPFIPIKSINLNGYKRNLKEFVL
jgi:hypothetical protein